MTLKYRVDDEAIVRELRSGDTTYSSSLPLPNAPSVERSLADLGILFDQTLSRHQRAEREHTRRRVLLGDAFSGIGGFSLGGLLAGDLVGLDVCPQVAIDTNDTALKLYSSYFADVKAVRANVDSLVDFNITRQRSLRFAYEPELVDGPLAGFKEGLDLVVAGPPCQGHSGFNNVSRRSDPRNRLYLSAAAFGVAAGAQVIVIENVPEVVLDEAQVVAKTAEVLDSAGYFVSEAVLNAEDFGVAQRRRRHFMVASRVGRADIDALASALTVPSRPISWAIDDLSTYRGQDSILDTPAALSEVNQKRIDFLFEQRLYDLPNSERPRSHRDGHTYPSVYGRLRWDGPSGVITRGFMSPGQGRFIHPTERRTLTIHEAFRIQGFPDWYVDRLHASEIGRRAIAAGIGEAVPPPLAAIPIAAGLLTII